MSTIPPFSAGIPPINPAASQAGTTRTRGTTDASPASALWQVLTDEERSYFQSMATLGPVSYGPGGAPSAQAQPPVGQRIDVSG